MRTSTDTKDLVAALILAQSVFPVIPKSHIAKVPTKSGGEYRYSYADYPDIKAICDPILYTYGLVITHVPEYLDGVDMLTTRLAYPEADQWIEGSMRLFLSAETPQAQGSAITYAKRYAYSAILGLVADEDDDGAAATYAKPPLAEQAADFSRGRSTITDPPTIMDIPGGVAPVWLNVPYDDKDRVKAAGGRWSTEKKSWYIPPGVDPSPFARWMGE